MIHRHGGKYKCITPRGRLVWKNNPSHKHSLIKVIKKPICGTVTVARRALSIYEAANSIKSHNKEEINGMINDALYSYLIPHYGTAKAATMLYDAARRRDFPQILRQWMELI